MHIERAQRLVGMIDVALHQRRFTGNLRMCVSDFLSVHSAGEEEYKGDKDDGRGSL